MKLHAVACPICKNLKYYKVLYRKNFTAADLNAKIFSARRIPDKIHYQIVKCHYCGLVRSSPVANAAILNNLYKKSKFTYEAELDNLNKSYLASLTTVLRRIRKKDHILEIGCGNGFLLSRLYKHGHKNVFGIEPSIDAVKKADRKIKRHIKVSLLKPGLFREGKFSLIFFFQTFDHVPNPNAFLKECYRLLKPGGYILSFNHDVDSLSSQVLREKSPIIDIEHTFLYSIQTIKKIFWKNKYKVIKAYSPYNFVSLKHLIWLLPIPKSIKMFFINSRLSFLNATFKLKLGNLCLVAQKK